MDEEAALAGARDILAENISDQAALRKELRRMILKTVFTFCPCEGRRQRLPDVL